MKAKSGNELLLLPSNSHELCFDTSEFTKKNFTVDQFLHANRNAGTLEIFRDDLGIYLKVLRSSMIELINNDYSDFVNLSANLIDLNQYINNIEAPLKELKSEVLSVKESFVDSIDQIKDLIEEKRRLQHLKKSLKNLENVKISLQKLRKLLDLRSQSNENDSNAFLERAAHELVQLQFNMKYCTKFLSAQEKKSLVELETEVISNINSFFLSTIKSNDNTENLEKCLRIYFALDQCSLAEIIFKEKIVNVHMEKIITQSNLQNSSVGLTAIYNQILDFVSTNMKTLISLTKKNGKIKGYNFMVNSFWTCTEEKLEQNIPSIFAPGDPDQFFQKYKCTMEFLSRIEMIIDDEELIKEFRLTEHYRRFHSRWNLPVYFKIRFQEIAVTVEQACSSETNILINSGESGQLQLVVLYQTLKSIVKCWTEGIYLGQLFPNFLKLTLQLLSRMIKWLDDLSKTDETKRLQSQNLDKLSFLVTLFNDTEIFLLKLPQIQQLVHQKQQEISKISNQQCFDDVKKTFARSTEFLKNYLDQVQLKICKELYASCSATLKVIQDTPRLFRKTNRDIPKKHLVYVEEIFHPVKNFLDKFDGKFSESMKMNLLGYVLTELTVQYTKSVSEVLASVQKTEEWLRRHKNLREKPNANSSTQPQMTLSASEKQLMSDDDKIRLQFKLDSNYFASQVDNFQKDMKIECLLQLIEDLSKSKL